MTARIKLNNKAKTLSENQELQHVKLYKLRNVRTYSFCSLRKFLRTQNSWEFSKTLSRSLTMRTSTKKKSKEILQIQKMILISVVSKFQRIFLKLKLNVSKINKIIRNYFSKEFQQNPQILREFCARLEAQLPTLNGWKCRSEN